MLAATPAFSDSTFGGMRDGYGVVHLGEQLFRRPAPSLPIKIANDPDKSTSPSGLVLCDDVAIIMLISALSSAATLLPNLAFAIGSRNTDPADARITFELKAPAVPSPSRTPPAPEGFG